MGDDEIDQMCKTLNENETVQNISIDEKKNFLCENINSVDLDAKKNICLVLLRNKKIYCIKDHNEGCIININDLTDQEITAMYDILFLYTNRLN